MRESTEDIECVSEPYDISHAPFIIHNSIHEIRRTCDRRVFRNKEKIPGIEFVYAPAFILQVTDAKQKLTESELSDCKSPVTSKTSGKEKCPSILEKDCEEDKKSVRGCESELKKKCCCKSARVQTSARTEKRTNKSHRSAALQGCYSARSTRTVRASC